MTANDIETRSDIELLMRAFYQRAMADEVIGDHFEELDLESHLPVMVDFWEKALFGKPVYFNNPLAVHQRLNERQPMVSSHFRRWVELFIAAVDELFAGATADSAKATARIVADSLDQRLNPDLRFDGIDIAAALR